MLIIVSFRKYYYLWLLLAAHMCACSMLSAGTDADALAQKAYECYYKANYKSAVRYYGMALKINPNVSIAHHIYANALAKTGNDYEAALQFSEALRNGEYPAGLGMNLFIAGYYERAGHFAEAATEVGKDPFLKDSKKIIITADIYNRNGVPNKAIEYLRKITSYDIESCSYEDYARLVHLCYATEYVDLIRIINENRKVMHGVGKAFYEMYY